MLNQNSRYNDVSTYKLLSTVSNLQAGSGLVSSLEDGEVKCSNGTGSNGEVFVGAAFAPYASVSSTTVVEEVTGPAGGGSITLSRTPADATAVQVATLDNSVSETAVSGAPTTASTFQIIGTVLTFHEDSAGISYLVTYSYNLTVIQAQELAGDGTAGNTASAVLESATVIRRGYIETDNFDTGSDWSTGEVLDIRLGVDGIFQVGGTGAVVNARVESVPSAENPFLGLFLQE